MTPERCDVLVVGGGLAGLTFALQLVRERPGTEILVVDRLNHPVPEAAFKVGESVSSVGSLYLREVLGLDEYMLSDQLEKLATRFFLPAAQHDEIDRRIEVGPSDFLVFRTYQLDRGRFENFLLEECRRSGVTVWDGSRVEDASIGDRDHEIRVRHGDQVRSLRARWIVDASGRSSFLKRRLGGESRSDHEINAAWFRVAGRVDPDSWSTDSAWRQRMRLGIRWLSTNHLMGDGYWVWLIPLASNSTSVGVVADPKRHPSKELYSLERTMDWLARHERQCARQVARHEVLDFRFMHSWAYKSMPLASTDGWLMTGESALFLDPLYSPGTDAIAITNTIAVPMVASSLNGQAVDEDVALLNFVIDTFYEVAIHFWRGTYSTMGNTAAALAKVIWDIYAYFVMLAVPYGSSRFLDRGFITALLPYVYEADVINQRVQSALKAWSSPQPYEGPGHFVDFRALPFFARLHEELSTVRDSAVGLALVPDHLEYLGAYAAEIIAWSEGRNQTESTSKYSEVARREVDMLRAIAAGVAD